MGAAAQRRVERRSEESPLAAQRRVEADEVRMAPSVGAIRAASTRLQALAASLGGDYDGWEAAVTR